MLSGDEFYDDVTSGELVQPDEGALLDIIEEADARLAEDDEPGPVSIHALAVHRGMKSDCGDGDGFSGNAYAAVGLALLGGCGCCGACLAGYNAYPSKSGVWKCADCIGDDGWTDPAEANRAIFGDEVKR